MEVIVDPKTGQRNRDFRPYIEQECQGNSLYLYDPNRPFHYGLYDTAGQPSCDSWVQNFHQYPSKVPISVIDSTGRLHPLRPSWWRNGLKYRDLNNHAQPTHRYVHR